MAKEPALRKNHKHERFRGGALYPERWTNAKAALVAFRTGQGRTSTAIAAELADGTSPETIRHLWKIWGLPYNGQDATIQVPISDQKRGLLAKRAADEGIEPEIWASNVLSFAIRDSMYKAIVEG